MQIGQRGRRDGGEAKDRRRQGQQRKPRWFVVRVLPPSEDACTYTRCFSSIHFELHEPPEIFGFPLAVIANLYGITYHDRQNLQTRPVSTTNYEKSVQSYLALLSLRLDDLTVYSTTLT